MQKIIKASIAQLNISKITENNQIQLNYPCQHFDAQNSKTTTPNTKFYPKKTNILATITQKQNKKQASKLKPKRIENEANSNQIKEYYQKND